MKKLNIGIISILILACLSLVSCATVEPKYVYKTEVISPKDEWLIDCELIEPPNKNEYMLGTVKDREKLLSNFASKLMNSIIVCNKRLADIREWKITAKEAIDKSANKP